MATAPASFRSAISLSSVFSSPLLTAATTWTRAEAWAAAGREGLIANSAWPEADPALLVEDEVTIAIQVNGKLRDTQRAPKGAPREELEAMAMANANVQRALGGSSPKKVIVVPDRLVNVVA